MMELEPVIGLEVHAQLLTRSKIFCGCSTRFGAPPNSNTCPVCLGLPGALPVLNREAVAMAVKAGLALGCQIPRKSIFARKNYFYPDLPKGYQISQYDLPLAKDGKMEILTGRRLKTGQVTEYEKRSFGITRVHLEEDAGKSIHRSGEDTYVDLNRTGVPLIEIVSEPDFRSSQEAYDYLNNLRRTLLYLGICDGNMEEGSLRCDANVSVRPAGSSALGTKTEIKNLNSFRFLQKALEYEIERQGKVLREGGKVEQQTRLWDEESQKTLVMRSKEEAHYNNKKPSLRSPWSFPVLVWHSVLTFINTVTFVGSATEPRSRRDDESMSRHRRGGTTKRWARPAPTLRADGGCGRSLCPSSSSMSLTSPPPPFATSPGKPHPQTLSYL